jgi:hypothetical protein
MITIATRAVEKSTFALVVTFYDELNALVIPNEIYWTLTNRQGDIINGLSHVMVGVPGSTITILLKGADLAIQSDEASSPASRLLTIEALYDSSLGLGLPFNEEAVFFIDNLTKIS